jgi:hypothetical protein
MQDLQSSGHNLTSAGSNEKFYRKRTETLTFILIAMRIF